MKYQHNQLGRILLIKKESPVVVTLLTKMYFVAENLSKIL